MNIRLAFLARQEVNEAADYYEASRPGLGTEFTDEFDVVYERIKLHPHAGTRFRKNYRLQILSRFPYTVYYSVNEDEIVIFAVAHQHRKPGYWLSRIAGNKDDKIKEPVTSYSTGTLSVYIQALQKAIWYNEFLAQSQTVDSDDYEESSHMYEVELSKLVELYMLEEKNGMY